MGKAKMPWEVLKSEIPLMRIGIISDVQMLPSIHDWGAHNLGLALDILAEKKIDLLVMAGDLAENGNPATYDLYWKTIQDRFPEKMPEHVACEGNHDYNGAKKAQDLSLRFKELCVGLRRPAVNPWHTVIGGYDFIALSTTDGFHYSEESLQALDDILRKAEERDSKKPVFIITHFPPSDTVSGSNGKTGVPGLRKVLEKYPRTVSISGHTHYPLEDERSIWQKDFTAFQTSSLSYGCIAEDKVYNTVGGILPFARECIQLLYMEIFQNHLEIHRYNVPDRREISPDKVWRVQIPYDPAKAVYTEKRIEERKAPQFPSDAKLLTRYDYGYMYLCFDSAVKGDFAQYYDVEIEESVQDGSFLPPVKTRYLGNFYRRQKNCADKIFLRLPGAMKDNHQYRIRVYPVESFGKRGTPLEILEHTWPGYPFKDGKGIYPQE